ncbi:MAG: tetratricopeptide repeat protein [Proteobacteria bacterium]|nr:tetratricopeptide repeat protein [Pseudomonadota bacterium]
MLRVAVVYLAAAWLLLQVVATIAPILGLPDSLQRIVLVLIAIGFPVALILAWVLELTPSGLKRDSDAEIPGRSNRQTLDNVIIVTLAAAVVYFVADKFIFGDAPAERSIARSVAVLPFTNMTQDESNEPFLLGIHDDLLTHLSRIKSVRTVSRTSMLQYRGTTKTIPQIADELNVATILEGSVQRSGDRIRINVQLIDAELDEHIWAETYDRELTAANVFEIQSEIATAIASELRAALTPKELQRLGAVPTQSIDALDTYFVGKQLLEERTRESLTVALEYFERTVELDPGFALGWAGLADAAMLLPEYSASADRKALRLRSDEAVARAMAIDADLPFVSSTIAWSKLIRDYDWAGAEKTFRHALLVQQDNTNVLHWLSHTVSWQGRHEEALKHARRAAEIEPDSQLMLMNLAYILIDALQYDEALAIASRMGSLDPGYTALRRNLYLHELRAGHTEDGAASFVTYTTLAGGDPVAAWEIADMFIAYANDGTVGNVSADLISRALLGSEDLGQVLAFVGDGEGALRALQQATDDRSGSRSVLSMKINPAYDFIRDDPRFTDLLKQIGLAK